MFVIKPKSENGIILLSLLFFLVFLAIMGTAVITVTLAESRAQSLYREERSVFYAAQSGLEYGIKKFLVSDVTNLTDWTETVDMGGGMSCDVEMEILGNNEVQISVSGGYGEYQKQLQTTINYIDVSEYAVYAGGEVEHVVTAPANLIYKNASLMPIFDMDELRSISKPFGYYSGNLTLTSWFYFPGNEMIFVEGDLTFSTFLVWFGSGHFTVMGNTYLNGLTAALLNPITIYQPDPNSTIVAERSITIIGRNLVGGIITEGNVLGSDDFEWPFFAGQLRVWHDRRKIISFMSSSLNGGSILIEKTAWKNLN